MMKKFYMIVLMIIVSLLTMSDVYAIEEVDVQINGEIVSFNDTVAQIITDRTMVPFRKIFNELGVTDENINWNGETKTIIAKKDDIEITLQIGNAEAQKKVGTKHEKITLDSAPVIRNDRTLVPLRFIAESLGKTVGWDAANHTAIIVDYDGLLQQINTKSPALYHFMMAESSQTSVTITRRYTDKDNNQNNNSAVINASIHEEQGNDVLTQNVKVTFTGNNDLMQDIQQEGWGEIQFENDYYNDYFISKALNEGLKKVYGQDQLKFRYEGLECEGKNTDSLADVLKAMCRINPNAMNVNTFQERKKEFTQLFNLFSGSSENLTTGTISSEKLLDIQYFDFTKFDNIIYDSPVNRVYSFLNSQIFNYDVTLEELCYDYPNINVTLQVNNLSLTIDFVLSNEYNEKVEYIIKIDK